MVITKLYKTMEDCVTIDDEDEVLHNDDDVLFVDQIFNIDREPILIDLTESDEANDEMPTDEQQSDDPNVQSDDSNQNTNQQHYQDYQQNNENHQYSSQEKPDEEQDQHQNSQPNDDNEQRPSSQDGEQGGPSSNGWFSKSEERPREQDSFFSQKQNVPNFERPQSQFHHNDKPHMNTSFEYINLPTNNIRPPQQVYLDHLNGHIHRQEQSKKSHVSDGEGANVKLPTANQQNPSTTPSPPPPTSPPPEVNKPSNQQQTHVQQPKKPQMSDQELMVAQKNLGNEKYKHNLFDDAIRTYKRANELAKKLGNTEMSAILHFNLAMTYYKLGSFEQAADQCAQAVKFNDKYLKAHLKRAEIYQRQCKFEEAVICYEHICELDSNNQDYVVLLNFAKEAAKKTKRRDPLQILGLNFNFTQEELKKAYRQKALSHHPDRHSDADIVTRRIEEKYFKDVSEAHTTIQQKYGSFSVRRR